MRTDGHGDRLGLDGVLRQDRRYAGLQAPARASAGHPWHLRPEFRRRSPIPCRARLPRRWCRPSRRRGASRSRDQDRRRHAVWSRCRRPARIPRRCARCPAAAAPARYRRRKSGSCRSCRATGFRHDQQHAAGIGELDGVADQVEQHLPHPSRIGGDQLRHVGRDVAAEPDALGEGLRRKQLDDIVGDLARRHRLRLGIESASLDLGIVEKIFDQRQKRAGRRRHRADIGALLRRQLGIGEQLGHAHDAVHRRADLVADGGEKPRLGLAGIFGPLAGIDQRRFGALARRDVARDRPVRDLIAGLVAHRQFDPREPARAARASGSRHRWNSGIRRLKRPRPARCRHRRQAPRASGRPDPADRRRPDRRTPCWHRRCSLRGRGAPRDRRARRSGRESAPRFPAAPTCGRRDSRSRRGYARNFREMIEAARLSARNARASTTSPAMPVARSTDREKGGAPVRWARPARTRIATMVAKDRMRGTRLGISGCSDGAATRRRAGASD